MTSGNIQEKSKTSIPEYDPPKRKNVKHAIGLDHSNIALENRLSIEK
ncbi:MAG: hypothetical protein ACYCYM_12035 [Saccharofermentanales bacterium]